jgi:plasmid replication initiation protein
MVLMTDKEIEQLKNKVLVQGNSFTMARRYDITASEADIIYMLLALLGKDDPVDKVYYIYVKDLEKITGRELSYGQVRKSTTRLISRVYEILEGKDVLQVGIISSARYVAGTGRIAIRIDPEVRPYLFGLKSNFTKYGFFMVMTLSSKYSKQLYEILSQFKSTGIFRISVHKLKYILGLVDEKDKKEKYTIWTLFARKVLDVAQKELEEYTDISFTYEAKKQGRKFSELEFKIRYRDQKSLLPSTTEDSTVYERLTKNFKLSEWQARIILAQVPMTDINRTLYDIQLKKANERIGNIGGFTVQTFENKYRLGLMGRNNASYTQQQVTQEELNTLREHLQKPP